MPLRLKGSLEAHVGHGGGDDEVAGEQAAGFEVARGHEQNSVAVDDVVAGSGQHAAVGVAVEGEADARSASLDFPGDVVGVKGAAFGVDIAAIGGDVEEGDARAGVKAAEELGGDGGGGSVGAVGDDAEAGRARGRGRSR